MQPQRGVGLVKLRAEVTMQLDVLIVAVVAGMCSCQQECSLPSNDDLEQVIADIIRFGDSSSLPTITVAR